MVCFDSFRYAAAALCLVLLVAPPSEAADSQFARSDSDARYFHQIDLYDADNRKITADSDRPYSSSKTCGRCHDYDTIAHGWHFNAFDPESRDGRPGEPWIWTDPRTGTQLPLSYRDWSHSYDPSKIGITPWQMTRYFGGRVPGGGFAAASEANLQSGDDDDPAQTAVSVESGDAESGDGDNGEADALADDGPLAGISRWQFSGELEIDCMACHAAAGVYDFNQRREQIEEENFAWAATAALRLGTVDGSVSRIKDDADPAAEETQEKLPKVMYDPARFASDGTVFMDLVRKPDSNACYQCHSNRIVGEDGIEPRWIHDDDVHLRAGMVCADCHRNGIDHHIVRGFRGEEHPAGSVVETLSCVGCHLGGEAGESATATVLSRPGRLGSPLPLHPGLPPVHFEKMSCTSCHAGPVPRDQALRIMTSLAHGLGAKEHRTGFELPAIAGPVFSKDEEGRLYPHRSMWPAFWGVVEEGQVRPLPPEAVYDLTRRSLRVRRDFISELVMPELGSSDLKDLLGEDRYRVEPQEWTDEERAKVEAEQVKQGTAEFQQKVAAALEAVEGELEVDQAVYVSAGKVYARGDQPDTVKTIELEDARATEMVQWPLAHQVRPAGWSLGVGGCVECHSEEGKIFASTIAAVGPGPDRGEPVTMASLQGVPADQQLAWNELFRGRSSFKYIVGGSLAILFATLLIGLGALAARLGGST